MYSLLHARLIVLLSVCLVLGSCSGSKDVGHTWKMLALTLPDRITPSMASVNMDYYALKQTHEPIFHLAHDGQYTSRVLSRWDRSVDSLQFTLCPAASSRFEGSDQAANAERASIAG